MGRKPEEEVFRKKVRSCLDASEYNRNAPFSRPVTFGTYPHRKGFGAAVRIRTLKQDSDREAMLKSQLQTEGAEEVDVRFTGPVVAVPLKEKRRPDYQPAPKTASQTREERQPVDRAVAQQTLRIGSSISLVNSRSGTLCFFARCRETGQIGLVSANHVIAGQDRAQLNDPILSPGGLDYGYRVASFVRYVPLAGEGEKVVDCAFARLETNDYDPSTLPGGLQLNSTPAKVEKGDIVLKSSEASTREGVVSAPDQDAFKMHYRSEIGLVLFEDQIEVESNDDELRFSETGDSGSLVYTKDGQPVGLLFAHTLAGGKNEMGLSYVNPLAAVLEQLNVELITSHVPIVVE